MVNFLSLFVCDDLIYFCFYTLLTFDMFFIRGIDDFSNLRPQGHELAKTKFTDKTSTKTMRHHISNSSNNSSKEDIGNITLFIYLRLEDKNSPAFPIKGKQMKLQSYFYNLQNHQMECQHFRAYA